MKRLTTNDFLDKAIADAKKKAEYHRKKSDSALGLDLEMTLESLGDPKNRQKWDAYFKKSSNQKMKEMDMHQDAHIHYETVARNLLFIRMFNKHAP